jgi:hypothetical protein
MKVLVRVLNYTPCHEDVWGSGGTDPTILTSAVYGGEWSASSHCHFNSREKSLRYPSYRTLGGTHGRYGRCGVFFNYFIFFTIYIVSQY